MIGSLPDTLADRSIEIRLRRRLHNEPLTRFRADRATDLGQLARMAARWASDHLEALRRADPSIPLGLHDRAADNWGPLFAIADEAGGEWPERTRQIAVAMAARDEDGGSCGSCCSPTFAKSLTTSRTANSRFLTVEARSLTLIGFAHSTSRAYWQKSRVARGPSGA